MDTMTEAIKSLTTTAKATAREAYYRALRDARDAVAGLTDGDSPAHDGALRDACEVIEALLPPAELR